MAISFHKGTDASWDLDNYHLYAPYAALNNRLWSDFFAADYEGYYNPLESIPYFLLRCVLLTSHPRLVAALAGLPYGILAVITVRLARVVLAGRPPWEALAAALLGLSGSTLLAEIGTPSGNIPAASFTLIGVLTVIGPAPPGAVTRGWLAPACAGLAIGCATGVKLTAAVFVPGLFLLAYRRIGAGRDLPVVALAYGAGILIGFTAAYGWWGYLLWQRFGDPFFPMLTSLFPTPWLPPNVSVHNVSFYPKTLLQWLFYPFFWLQGHGYVVIEQKIRDPRFAIAYLATAVMVARRWMGRLGPPPRAATGIHLFFWIGYAAWLLVFSYIHYALALEAITGIVIWSAVLPLMPKRAGQILLCAVLVFSLAVTNRYTLGKIPYSASLLEPGPPRLPTGSLVFMSGQPIGFMAYELRGDGISFIGLDRLVGVAPEIRAVEQALAAGRPAELLTNRPLDSTGLPIIDSELAPVGLMVTEQTCRPVAIKLKWTAAQPMLCHVASGRDVAGHGAISPSPAGR